MIASTFSIMIEFPSPIALEIGHLAIRWYSLAYVFGILLGYWCIIWLDKYQTISKSEMDSLFSWTIVGIVLGGRIGYVLFYNFDFYLNHPEEIVKVWQGGMSFHGGMIGVLVVVLKLFWHNRKKITAVCDLIACVAPIGLFLGRISNFINIELVGRPTKMPWGIIFPGDSTVRHPSQLYEAVIEGLVMFAVIMSLALFTEARKYKGLITGIASVWYGVARFTIEFFREPDPQIGYIISGLTMGQLLSIPMIFIGCYLIFRSLHTQAASGLAI